MTRLTVAQVKDLQNQGGMTFSNGAITSNGTLTVSNIVINGTLSGSSGYIIPNQSGQPAGSFLTITVLHYRGPLIVVTKVFLTQSQYIMVAVHGTNHQV